LPPSTKAILINYKFRELREWFEVGPLPAVANAGSTFEVQRCARHSFSDGGFDVRCSSFSLSVQFFPCPSPFFEYPITNKEYPISKCLGSHSDLFGASQTCFEGGFISSLDIPCWLLDIRYSELRYPLLCVRTIPHSPFSIPHYCNFSAPSPISAQMMAQIQNRTVIFPSGISFISK